MNKAEDGAYQNLRTLTTMKVPPCSTVVAGEGLKRLNDSTEIPEAACIMLI